MLVVLGEGGGVKARTQGGGEEEEHVIRSVILCACVALHTVYSRHVVGNNSNGSGYRRR